MDLYKKEKYVFNINQNNEPEYKYIYGHYNQELNTWGFKDYNNCTLVNLCFSDIKPNKLDAIISIYNGGGIIISKDEFYGR